MARIFFLRDNAVFLKIYEAQESILELGTYLSLIKPHFQQNYRMFGGGEELRKFSDIPRTPSFSNFTPVVLLRYNYGNW